MFNVIVALDEHQINRTTGERKKRKKKKKTNVFPRKYSMRTRV